MSSIKQINCISLFFGLVTAGIALVTVSSINNFALDKLTPSDGLIIGGSGLFGCIGTNFMLRKALDSAKKHRDETLPISSVKSLDNRSVAVAFNEEDDDEADESNPFIFGNIRNVKQQFQS